MRGWKETARRKEKVNTMKNANKLFIALLAVSSLISSCAGKVPEKSAGKFKVAVSLPPVGYIVSRIGGDALPVETLMKPGQSPHSFEPSPKQVVAISGANLYFTTAFQFEKTMEPKLKSANANMKIIDALRGQTLLSHDGEIDPHVWMSPAAALKLSEVIHEELVAADPSARERYDAGFAALKSELEELDRDVSKTMSGLKARSFFTLHPAYGYFAGEFGLEQVAIEHEGKEPGQKTLAGIIERAIKDKAEVVFIQPQISDKGARAVADAVGAKLVTVDPLYENFIESIRTLAAEIAESAKKAE